MTSQTARQIMAMYVLPNISEIKGNQAKKFGQLIEYNVRNLFLHKSFRKWGREQMDQILLSGCLYFLRY